MAENGPLWWCVPVPSTVLVFPFSPVDAYLDVLHRRCLDVWHRRRQRHADHPHHAFLHRALRQRSRRQHRRRHGGHLATARARLADGHLWSDARGWPGHCSRHRRSAVFGRTSHRVALDRVSDGDYNDGAVGGGCVLSRRNVCPAATCGQSAPSETGDWELRHACDGEFCPEAGVVRAIQLYLLLLTRHALARGTRPIGQGSVV